MAHACGSVRLQHVNQLSCALVHCNYSHLCLSLSNLFSIFAEHSGLSVSPRVDVLPSNQELYTATPGYIFTYHLQHTQRTASRCSCAGNTAGRIRLHTCYAAHATLPPSPSSNIASPSTTALPASVGACPYCNNSYLHFISLASSHAPALCVLWLAWELGTCSHYGLFCRMFCWHCMARALLHFMACQSVCGSAIFRIQDETQFCEGKVDHCLVQDGLGLLQASTHSEKCEVSLTLSPLSRKRTRGLQHCWVEALCASTAFQDLEQIITQWHIISSSPALCESCEVVHSSIVDCFERGVFRQSHHTQLAVAFVHQRKCLEP